MKKKIIEDESKLPFDDEPIDAGGTCLLVGFSDEEYEDICHAARNEHISAEQFIQEATRKRLWDLIPTIDYLELETKDGGSIWIPPER